MVINWVKQIKSYDPKCQCNSIFSSLPLSWNQEKQSDVLANSIKIAVWCVTNAGLENSMKAILKKEPKTKIIKIGKETEDPMIIPYTIDSEYMRRNKDYKLHDHSETMRVQKEIPLEYEVVCCTCSSAVSAILEDIQFALVVTDEAAQATEAETTYGNCERS